MAATPPVDAPERTGADPRTMIRRGFSLVLPLLLAAVSAGYATAQEREARERETQDTIPPDSIVRDTVRPPPPTLGYQPAAFSVALHVGRPGSGEAQTQPVRAWRTDLDGAVLDSAALTRTAKVRGTVSAGLAAILGLGPDWALRLGASVAIATLEASYRGDNEIYVTTANAVAGRPLDLRVLSLESGLRYRIPSGKRVQPFLELGTAVSRWSTENAPSNTPFSSATRFEAVAGVGGVIPLSRHFSARLHASTRIFQTPAPTRPPGDTVATSSTLVLVSNATATSPFADGAREILDLLRLRVGVSWDLARPAPQRPAAPPEEAPADTTSPPGR